jgi:futalosine hydrolase
MNIIITAATSFELNFLKENLQQTKHQIHFLVHGVGMLQAAYHLAMMNKLNPDLIIQCGIAGSYQPHICIGDVVCINQESLGDTGAENLNEIIDFSTFDFFDKNQFPFIDAKLINPFRIPCSLPIAKGITVNMCAGNEATIKHRINFFKPDVETMEGAALHYVCLQQNIPFLQIRGISNFVEPRNRNNWNIDLAIKNYQNYIVTFIQTQL